jgi:hypothetical protein
MRMSDEPDLRALRLEWLVARAVFALGIVLSAAVFLWLTLNRPPVLAPAGSDDVGSAASDSGAQAGSSDAASQGRQFCASTVAVAQAFGVVPAAASPDGMPQKTDVEGRYVCVAKNGPAQFTISVDLVCRDLADQHCFNLFTVTQGDGSVLFQRQG